MKWPFASFAYQKQAFLLFEKTRINYINNKNNTA